MERMKMSSISKLKVFVLLTFSFQICQTSNDNGACTKETCPDSFSYPKDLDWDSTTHAELWGWLKSQTKKEVVTFCKENYPNEVSSYQRFSIKVRD
jgi:hypothetical protein